MNLPELSSSDQRVLEIERINALEQLEINLRDRTHHLWQKQERFALARRRSSTFGFLPHGRIDTRDPTSLDGHRGLNASLEFASIRFVSMAKMYIGSWNCFEHPFEVFESWLQIIAVLILEDLKSFWIPSNAELESWWKRAGFVATEHLLQTLVKAWMAMARDHERVAYLARKELMGRLSVSAAEAVE
jgi:hypothetical protein